MSYTIPKNLEPLAEQPVERIEEAFGLYFRSVLLPHANTYIPVHKHDHDHATLVGSGRARGWADGVWIGDKGPGEAFEVRAGLEHMFVAIEPNTRLICVHDVVSAEYLKAKGL